MARRRIFVTGLVLLCMAALSTGAWAQLSDSCAGLPDHDTLQNKLQTAVATETSGLNLNMWATVVARDGTVCAVAFSGDNSGSQWLGSRVISAQKANTANLFSLDFTSHSNTTHSGDGNGLALSTANLYSAVQPGGSLFGLQESNPVDTSVAYAGSSSNYGTASDPMKGNKIGGINVFGGGLGLYATGKVLVGGLGVSGDTSCADHMIGWRLRHLLNLDYLSGVDGVSGDPAHPDNIIYDIKTNPLGGTGISASGFGHPTCPNTDLNVKALPAVQ